MRRATIAPTTTTTTTTRAPVCLLWQHWPHAQPAPCVVLGTTAGGRVRIRWQYKAGDPVRDRYCPVNQLHPLAPDERERYRATFDELILSVCGVQVAPPVEIVEPDAPVTATSTTGQNGVTLASALVWSLVRQEA